MDPSEEPSWETLQPNPPNEGRIAPKEQEAAEPTPIMPTRPNTPKVVNDDAPPEMIDVAGMKIPSVLIAEWEATYVELSLTQQGGPPALPGRQ